MNELIPNWSLEEKQMSLHFPDFPYFVSTHNRSNILNDVFFPRYKGFVVDKEEHLALFLMTFIDGISESKKNSMTNSL